MQAFGKRNVTVTATKRNAAVTGDVKRKATAIGDVKRNATATADAKRNAVTVTTLTSNPSSEVASSELVASLEMVAPLEKTTTGLVSGEITRLTQYK